MRWFVAVLLWDSRIGIGFTRPEAARAFGCSDGTIYYWEKGERHPRPSEVAQIALTYRLTEKVRRYLKMILERKDSQRIEADPRLHALVLSKAELHSGFIFKYEPNLIPGPLQTRDYHFGYTQKAEGTSDTDANEGWTFKHGRQVGIGNRKDEPTIQYLIGNSAILGLRDLPLEAAIGQVNRMLADQDRSGVEIRVIAKFHRGRNAPFEIFKPGGSRTAPPVFVYSESLHGSWCIEEDALVAMYDGAGQAMWQLGIPLKEFLDEHCRDLLA
ncbi:Scr1 family TA system antitoxin-like transcriptional regulator [Glycomyces paridis]|uniref:Helix-turn-helix domain-containing protein n=1 Tax=Glycomyces paridis TaxID=2126555 RepID=A0A4S8PMM9_9ACTN|nr:Scr1 family TA system antitoxin-like transcriptional regulator [Glycomyces paridis]THV32108.1 helix-turn-helix domain-containing protein [Glycomyces paridis]